MKILLAALVVSLLSSAAAAGQRADAGPSDLPGERGPIAGWSVTPTFLVSRMFDDNVLLHGPGDPQSTDYINVFNPRAEVGYTGRRDQVAMRYEGAFIVYNNLNTLNSYDQHASFSSKHRLSKRNSFFANYSAAASPTTELLQLSGIPYVRAGVFTQSMHAGFESQVSKRLSVTVDGYFDQARFDANEVYANILLGGHGLGAGVSLRHRLNDRTSFTADGNIQHETIGTVGQQFDIQHALGGVERQLTEGIRVFAAGGVSRLSETPFGPARIGPSMNFGLSEHIRSTVIDVSYTRSFVPSFGFGGTTSNGNLTARVRLPITRRIYTQDLVSWQQQDPLVIAVPALRSTWIQAAVGYTTTSWFHIEAYFAGTRQTAGREDGTLLTHHQIGVQVIASKPMRLR